MNYIDVIKDIRTAKDKTVYNAIEEFMVDRVSKLSTQLRNVKAENVWDVAYIQWQIQWLESFYMIINQPKDVMDKHNVKETNKNKISYFFKTLFWYTF